MKFVLIAVAVAVLAAQQGTLPKTLDNLMDRVFTPPPETFGDCRKVGCGTESPVFVASATRSNRGSCGRPVGPGALSEHSSSVDQGHMRKV
jgi:hypothetical protein